jgi:hypothetical protein
MAERRTYQALKKTQRFLKDFSRRKAQHPTRWKRKCRFGDTVISDFSAPVTARAMKFSPVSSMAAPAVNSGYQRRLLTDGSRRFSCAKEVLIMMYADPGTDVSISVFRGNHSNQGDTADVNLSGYLVSLL